MGRVKYAFPLEELRGKANKKDSVYFCTRMGKSFIRRLDNPYKGDMTVSQLVSQAKFRTAAQTASSVMNDKTSDAYKEMLEAWKANPKGCYTLYGYVFKKTYEEL